MKIISSAKRKFLAAKMFLLLDVIKIQNDIWNKRKWNTKIKLYYTELGIIGQKKKYLDVKRYNIEFLMK